MRFPYSVLEIKLTGDCRPQWIQELLASGLLVEVTRFSKFLHGKSTHTYTHAAAQTHMHTRACTTTVR